MSFIILVGMMGSGKTTVGRLLAERLQIPFFDTDQILTAKLGRPIPQLFELYGEKAFRDHESRVLADLTAQSGVLATGGGIVMRPENWVQMKRLGTTFFLDPDETTLKERLARAKKRRPLLETENWEDRVSEIRQSRLDQYRQADHQLQIDSEDLEVVVERIAKIIEAMQ